MKILLYGINYSPELTGIGKYSGEQARWLASKGHEVRVSRRRRITRNGRSARGTRRGVFAPSRSTA